MYAPIIVFCYNRLEHLNKTLSSLGKNHYAIYSDLIIFLDGPKNESDELSQLQIISMIENHRKNFNSLVIVRREKNLGLANSIISGVTETLQKYETVIVLEDDMVTSPYFLKYLNDGLVRYKNNEKVCSIHGYFYPVQDRVPETFFLRGADCWGWATWRRAWADFEKDGKILAEALVAKSLINDFNYDGTYNFYQMLLDQISKKNDSWAIRWHAHNFLKNCLTLYPGESLVQNIGLDGSGTHCDASSTYDITLRHKEIISFPNHVEVSLKARKSLIKFFRNSNKVSLKENFRKFFKRIFK